MRALVEELPEPELRPARRFLEYLRRQAEDLLPEALATAPMDDEPLTEEDLEAIRQGFEERSRGEVVSHDKVKRLLLESR